MNLIGRNEEKITLEEFFQSDRPEFLAIYGRRRIGKTFLIKQIFAEKDCFFFNVTGVQNGKISTQINRFIKEIGKVFYQGAELKEPESWIDTFDMLSDAIEKIVPKDKKVVLFFDEFPWMATHKSGLLQALEHRWNHSWSNDKRIKLIICGSSASWIINKIINNKGGLHNRITRKIHLMPFNLKDTASLLANQNINLNHKQITELYMTTGGVPYYLLPAEKNMSATQIVDKLAFQQNSLLFEEFDNLFSSLFENSETYVELLRVIAKSHTGIGLEEIVNQSEQISRGGRIIERLKELEDTGFIISFMPHWHKKRGKYYRLIDEYTSFYLDWIEPVRNTLQKGSLEPGYWLEKHNSPTWYNWAGYAFESICYEHLKQIRKKLKISPSAIANGWRYVPAPKSKETGAQIDLLFERDDDTITICEIKYTTEPFSITKDYAENLKNKIAIFKEKTRTKKQIFLVIISANGIKNTIYSDALIQDVVTLEDLFK
jgi:AAA+ ATPase superfamily predicted ATPase